MRLSEIVEGLDSNQRRVGQVGAEEKANKVSPVLGHKDKQHPFKGRLVGESAKELNVGDPVIITGNVNFKGKTGDIDGFGKDKKFVIVNLYNYGRHSFHASDVSYNDYADEDLDEASLATMRDYFAGNKDARDELEITKQRKYFDELKRKEEEERKRKAALQRGVTRIGGSALGEATGLSPELLSRYKKAAGADATAADKKGDIARGNKRFKGIIRATKKEFDNDLKKK